MQLLKIYVNILEQQKVALPKKVIRDMFGLEYWDKEFSISHMKESNPFSGFVMINGMIFDKRFLPPEVQEFINNE
jgi:hypothetical protein